MYELMQTALWVMLIVGVMIWHRDVLGRIFRAIAKRIEDGDEVGAGPFQIKGARLTVPAEDRQHRLREAKAFQAGIKEEDRSECGNAPSRSSAKSSPDPVHANDAPDSLRSSIEQAINDVRDAQDLGLRWLAKELSQFPTPGVFYRGRVFDGALLSASGLFRGFVMTKLIGSVQDLKAALAEVGKVVAELNGEASLYVVLVTSNTFPVDQTVWIHMTVEENAMAEFFEIDLSHLRSYFGLGPTGT